MDTFILKILLSADSPDLKRGSKVAFAATHGKIALNKECSSILLKYSKTSDLVC